MGEVRSAEAVTEAPAAQPWTSYIPAATGLAALMAAIALVVFARHQAVPTWQPLVLAAIAFCCEFVDSSLGMGYGRRSRRCSF